MAVDRTCIKDGPPLTLTALQWVPDGIEKEARKTQNHMKENSGEGKVNAWKGRRLGAARGAKQGSLHWTKQYAITKYKIQITEITH